ncbi:MAG: hypothetical protein AAB603_01325 [Patescibacteria group bacterium]
MPLQEEYEKIIFQGRGGCLDALVTFMSFGSLGIRTTVFQTTLKQLVEDERGFASLEGTSTEVMLREMKPRSTYFGPRTERKIIKTPKNKLTS